MLFKHDITADENLSVGDAFGWSGDIWRVDSVSRDDDGGPRLELGLWPNGVPYPARIYGIDPRQ